jgi:hypothetical protein
MELQVDNDVDKPCKDEVIEEATKGFVIDSLDWKKTDMCIDVVFKIAPQVRKLRLYSSGNHAVLKSWSATDGLPLFANVCSRRSFHSNHY